jgi:DNA-binding transcriptional LysR family regulator
MELRHLRYFVAVAEELHFRRAAERLHVAQPAVSEQVRKLEEELGVRLFDRNQRRVELTDAGAAMLDEARQVLRQAQSAQRAARNARDRATLRLRIGYVPDSVPTIVPRALRGLASGKPAVHATLETGAALDLLTSVREGRLDAAIVCLPAPTRGLRTLVLGTEPAVAALPAGDPRAVQDHVDLRQMAPDRIVVLPRRSNPAFYDAVVTTCRTAGFSPTLIDAGECHVEHALLAVASGSGMALLPASVADRYTAPGIRFLPVSAPPLLVQTAVVTGPTGLEHRPTVAFLRALSRASRLHAVTPPAAPEPAIAAA